MTRHLRAVPDGGIRCEQFCTEPIGPDGDPGGDGFLACCARCRVTLRWISHDVLPSIRRYGYYAPTGSSTEVEAAAMVDQDGLRGHLERFLGEWGADLDGGAC